MKIDTIVIKKFRSIKECKIHFSTINALVGENNSGKTAVLRALNSIFNFKDEEKYFINNAHKHAPRSNTSINIILSDIPDTEFYREKINNDRLIIEFSYNYSNHRRTLSYITTNGKTTIDENFINVLKSDINYIYIHADRNSRDVTWNSDSIFSKLIDAYSASYTQNRDFISSKVKSTGNNFKSKVISSINKQISELIPNKTIGNFAIDFNDKIDYSLFLSKLSIYIENDDNRYPITEYGSGIISLTAIALYRALGQLSHANIILGIEEPETNLHPQAQKEFISSLRKNMKDNEVQAIISTHSTVIVDSLQHEDIILVRRESNEKRGFISTISQIDKSFWKMHNLVSTKHYNFFRFRNSDFFFSKYVIIAESSTDVQVFEKLIKDKIGDDILNVSFLQLGGVTSAKYPYYLLKDLKIPFSLIVDKDFFTPYLNDELKFSRDKKTGLPQYKKELDSTNELLFNIFDENQRKIILSKIEKNYKSIFEYLKSHNIYTMNYCLEMDLICSTQARSIYYELLNIGPEHQTQKELLLNNAKAIKKFEYILEIINRIDSKSYPISFKKITKSICENIKQNMIY